jgi:type 1 glutamine amidotransferase
MLKRLFYLSAMLVSVGLTSTMMAQRTAHIVFMIGEDEYHTWETLPDFAKRELEPKGYRVTIVQQDEKDKNNFPGLVDALRSADLLFVSVRRRTPPIDQLNAVRAHLDAGKPLVGIRTACHAFALRPADPPAAPDHGVWQAFDPEVLGGHYTNHHPEGPRTTVTVAAGAQGHQILKGLSIPSLFGSGSLYKVSPLEQGTTPLLIGAIPDQPSEPIAWTHHYGAKGARVFFTSFGHPDDFKNAEFRRLLVNGIAWALAR